MDPLHKIPHKFELAASLNFEITRTVYPVCLIAKEHITLDLSADRSLSDHSLSVVMDPKTCEETTTAVALSTLNTLTLAEIPKAAPKPNGGAGLSLGAVAASGSSALAAKTDVREDSLSVAGVEPFYEIRNIPISLFPRCDIEKTPDLLEKVDEAIKLRYKGGEKVQLISMDRAMLSGVAWEDPSQHSIAMPTDEGLLLLSAYYQTKYDSTILVASNPEKLASCLKGEGLAEETKVWGVIATYGDTSRPHVTPLICARQADGSIQILNLDSVALSVTHVADAIGILRSEGVNFSTKRTSDERQADNYSCRTDALVVLKDALQDLKEKKVTDLNTHLSHLIEGRYITLPASWGKTVQKSSAIAGQDLTQKVVGKKGESIERFQDRFKKPMQRKETVAINSTTTIGPRGFEVERTQVLRVNRFLNYKGKRNLALVKKLIAENPSDVMTRYAELKKRYS